MGTALPTEVDAAEHRGMHTGSALIGIVVVIQLVANLGFWVAASRTVASDALGDAGELFTSLQFVVYLTGMGLTVTNSRFGALRASAADGLLSWSIVITISSSLVGAAVYLGAMHLLSEIGEVATPETLSLLTAGPRGIAGLFVLTAGTSVALLVDVRLMAMRRYDVLIGRAVVIGAARIALIGIEQPFDDALWVFVLNVVPTGLYAVGGLLWLRARQGVHLHLRPRPEPTRQIARFAAVNYGATLAMEAPVFALPVIVGTWMSGADYANFFVAWSASAAGLLLPAAIAQVALVEGSRLRSASDDHTRTALTIALGIAVLGLVAAMLANDVITLVYGEDYRIAERNLPYFMAAAVPWAIASVLLSSARIRRDHLTTIAITIALGAGSIIPALLLVPDMGTSGAIWAWVGGTTLAAVCAVALSLARSELAPPGAAHVEPG